MEQNNQHQQLAQDNQQQVLPKKANCLVIDDVYQEIKFILTNEKPKDEVNKNG